MPKFDHSISNPDYINAQNTELDASGLSKCRCGECIEPIYTAVKCLYCGEWFCLKCAEDHFGMTRKEWKGNKVLSCS